MPQVLVNSIHMYYEVHGVGKPLVIINGLSTDISKFQKVFEPFTKQYKVLMLDNRGAGRSDKPDEPYSIEQMANDTKQVMEAAGYTNATVLGISMGGRIALELALSEPRLVNKLILVSTAPKRIAKRTWKHHFIFNIVPHLPLFKGSYPQPYYAYRRQHQASMSYDGSARLGELTMPTLILHGDHDTIVPLADAEKMAAGIHNSQLTVFRGGHLFFILRERQKFIDSVRTFI